jgi:hypothetical protein
LVEADQKYASHPREVLDLLCVADVGTWAKTTLSLMTADAVNRARELGLSSPSGTQFGKGIAWTSYFSHAVEAKNQLETFTPIGCLFSYLTRKLAWENPSLRQLAEYYPKTGIEGAGQGNVRLWAPPLIYSDEVYAQLPARMRGGAWDEWTIFFH